MARIALAIMDWFVALTALAGGVALTAGLEAARFPADMLRGSPFSDYVVPGLILALVVGGSAAVAAATTSIRPGVGARASVLAGVVLMGWIGAEILLVTAARSWLEAFYLAVGISMVALGVLVARARGDVAA